MCDCEEDAYQRGYEEGSDEGYDNGFEEGREEGRLDAQYDVEDAIMDTLYAALANIKYAGIAVHKAEHSDSMYAAAWDRCFAPSCTALAEAFEKVKGKI